VTADPGDLPFLSVVRGAPTDAEIAAITAVLAARARAVAAVAPPQAPVPPSRSQWSGKASLVRQPLHRGPGAWRASARGW